MNCWTSATPSDRNISVLDQTYPGVGIFLTLAAGGGGGGGGGGG